jgi:hypothetical protein
VQVCSTVVKNVVANDTDPEGNYPLSLVSVSYQGLRGTAYVASSTSVGFDAGSTTASVVVSYTVKDSLGATSTGSLVVTITSGQCL